MKPVNSLPCWEGHDRVQSWTDELNSILSCPVLTLWDQHVNYTTNITIYVKVCQVRFPPSDFSTKFSTHFSDPLGTQHEKTHLKLLFIIIIIIIIIITYLLLLFLMSKHYMQDLIPPYKNN